MENTRNVKVYCANEDIHDKKLLIRTDKINLNYDFPLHTHKGYTEIVFVLQGSAEHIIGQTTTQLTCGDICILNHNVEHGYCNTRDFILCNIMLDDTFVFPNDIKDLPGFKVLFTLEPLFDQTLHFKSCLHLNAEQIKGVAKIIDEMQKEEREMQAG